MNIKIVSKDLTATEAIKDYIGKKSERLVKYFGEDFDVTATIKTEGGLQVAEMEVKTPTDRFRATTEHKDLYASIDKDIDILNGIDLLFSLPNNKIINKRIKNKKRIETTRAGGYVRLIKCVYFIL